MLRPAEAVAAPGGWGAARLLPLALMCAVPLLLGVQATSGLRWPHDADLSRNIAQAQTIAEGDLWGDPYYRGERLWYNPLLPLMVAALATVSDVPVPVMYIRSGPFLNLLAPIAFFFLMHRFFGGVAAVAATFHWLFLRPPRDPAWAIATFTPWLFASNIAQIFFYLALLSYRRALAAGTWRSYAATGAAVGAAFLVHVAPALLFGGIAVLVCAGRLIGARGNGFTGEAARLLKGHALLFGVSLLLALWYVGPIFLRYRFHISNPAPNDWVWGPLAFDQAPRLFAAQLTWYNLAAAVGLVVLLRRPARGRIESRLVLLWLVVSGLLVAYGLLSDWASRRGIHLQNVVPIHHFWFYLKGAESVFWGCGLAWVAGRIASRWPDHPMVRHVAAAPTVLSIAAVSAGLAIVYPSYAERGFFTIARQHALRQGRNLAHNRAHRWIRENTRPGDVFLAWDDLAQHLIGPAGRKTIVIPEGFSNPYVEWTKRAADRRAM